MCNHTFWRFLFLYIIPTFFLPENNGTSEEEGIWYGSQFTQDVIVKQTEIMEIPPDYNETETEFQKLSTASNHTETKTSDLEHESVKMFSSKFSPDGNKANVDSYASYQTEFF